ncbi:RNA 3'-terminal phosphate cyclase [Neorhodopirellula pilleata]|uniref:RNA 3'-terminal phosphate cyclase n=1 Tax=Neorhodopirellula pilleata TaxID=2714738 RepID=A0A5C6AQX3_9BACT|nr:RNA 3'-terminal phosphate cyclase [Neorhodopirellula pilleata]TWU01466.1 RNA 3'-terminal phosphate cyclase [Neorhodopirellula pilleata]
MIEINGSEGEGGGQIVRSSLALAAVTGQEIRLTNIRGGRSKPGLLRQHLAGVRAITQICQGETTGDELGSNELTMRPGSLVGGDFRFDVGSAGSAVLVAQTILPALMMAERPSTVTIGGGTHAAWAPPLDFFKRCYLPLLEQMGAKASVQLDAYGFYPAGGGRIVMHVEPTPVLSGLRLVHRTGEMRGRVIALVAKVPLSVGERECDVIARKMGWDGSACQVIDAQPSGGPGNVVMIELGFDSFTELFIGFGKVGVKAEHVARTTLRQARQYLTGEAPVGEYLADQLLLPMGLAARSGHASEFVTGPLSLHSQTHITVLQRFLDLDIQTFEKENGSVRVAISPA